MLSINDLKSGSLIIIEGAPYQVLEVSHLHMGRGGSSVQTKIRNLKTGQTYNRNFKPADTFEEAEVEKKPVVFLYHHRGEFVFAEPGNPKNRFPIPEDIIGENKKWLHPVRSQIPKASADATGRLTSNGVKPGTELTVLFFDEKPINIQLPIKMDFKVTEAPPGLQGDRSQAGTKTVTIETGAVVQAPLFINTDDVVRINTETGEYVERVKKS